MSPLVTLFRTNHSYLSQERYNDVKLISGDGVQASSSSALLSIATKYGDALKDVFEKDETAFVSVELGSEDLNMVLEFVHSGVVPMELDADKLSAFNTFGIQMAGKKFVKTSASDPLVVQGDSGVTVLIEAGESKEVPKETPSKEDDMYTVVAGKCEVQLEVLDKDAVIDDLPMTPIKDESVYSDGSIHSNDDSEDGIPWDFSDDQDYEEQIEEKKPVIKKRKRTPKVKKEEKSGENTFQWREYLPKDKSEHEPGICTLCNTNNQHLPGHMEYMHSVKNTTCDVCGRIYKDKTRRDKHVSAQHQDVCCEVCGKVLGSKATLRLHMISIHGNEAERPFKCDECPKAYAMVSKLNEHKRTAHSDVRSHICDVCGRAQKSRARLTQHKRIEHGIRTRQPALNPQPNTLSDFVMGKDGTLRPRTFRNKSIKVLEGQLPDPKNRDFIEEQKAKRVRKRAPALTTEELEAMNIKYISEMHVKCMVCERSFEYKGSAVKSYAHNIIRSCKNHILAQHSSAEDRPFPCTKCDKRFVRKEVLEYHMNTHENKRSFTCSFCPSAFNHIGNRNAHERSVHMGIKKKGLVTKSRRNTGCKKAKEETAEERRERWMSCSMGEPPATANSDQNIQPMPAQAAAQDNFTML